MWVATHLKGTLNSKTESCLMCWKCSKMNFQFNKKNHTPKSNQNQSPKNVMGDWKCNIFFNCYRGSTIWFSIFRKIKAYKKYFCRFSLWLHCFLCWNSKTCNIFNLPPDSWEIHFGCLMGIENDSVKLKIHFRVYTTH